MLPTNKIYRTNSFIAAVAAFSITGLWFLLTWRYGFDLADEGFYWYGAQRILFGEVPMRDFMSYDIGRYYWAATIMRFMGDDGVFPARLSAAAYQVLGTFLGVYICLLALRADRIVRWIFALLVACIITVWVNPYYKSYDHATSIIIVAMLVLMLKINKPAAWLVSGVCLGIAALMGRNHGVYGAFAVMFLILVLFIKAPSRQDIIKLSGYFALGVVVGFSPTLIMMLAVNGFSSAFIDSIVIMFKYGATNIGLPVPWPWSIQLGDSGSLFTAVKLLNGMGFVFLILFPVLGILLLVFGKFNLSSDARIVFFSAVIAAIPYAHYAFSRADVTHLALGILPALIGVLAASAFMKTRVSLFVASGMLVTSVISVSELNVYLTAHLLKWKVDQVMVDGKKLWLEPYVSKDLQMVTEVLSNNNFTQGFLVLPNMPSIHAIYREKMPIWEIYSLIPRDSEFESKEIKLLEKSQPSVIIISNHALDGNKEFRYSSMHPMIYKWVASTYGVVDFVEKNNNPDFFVYFRD